MESGLHNVLSGSLSCVYLSRENDAHTRTGRLVLFHTTLLKVSTTSGTSIARKKSRLTSATRLLLVRGGFGESSIISHYTAFPNFLSLKVKTPAYGSSFPTSFPLSGFVSLRICNLIGSSVITKPYNFTHSSHSLFKSGFLSCRLIIPSMKYGKGG